MNCSSFRKIDVSLHSLTLRSLFCVSCFVVLSDVTAAQLRELQIPSQEPEQTSAFRYHGEVPWTEAELDPDVAKRPRFVASLHLSRVIPSFPSPIALRVPRERLDERELAKTKSLLESILATRSLPSSWDDVEWHGTGFYLLPNEPNSVECSWNITTGKIIAGRGYGSSGVGVRLQRSEEKLEIRPRPPQTEEFRPGAAAWDDWAVVDREAFHKVLTSLLRVPFNSPEDYILKQGGREFEGVMVFHGILRAAETRGDGRRELRPRSASAWHHRINVLVTDSDPQYFGVSIDLRAEAESSRKDTKITPQEP